MDQWKKTNQHFLSAAAIEKLRRIIPFDENDLTINRRFKLSDSQRDYLKPKVDLVFFLTILAVFVSAVMTAAVFFASQSSPVWFPIAVVLGIVTLISVIALVIACRVKLQLIRKEGVRSVAGKAALRIFYSGENSDIPKYLMEIKGVEFRLTEELYDAFVAEKFCVYYFCILHNEILAVEAID